MQTRSQNSARSIILMKSATFSAPSAQRRLPHSLSVSSRSPIFFGGRWTTSQETIITASRSTTSAPMSATLPSIFHATSRIKPALPLSTISTVCAFRRRRNCLLTRISSSRTSLRGSVLRISTPFSASSSSLKASRQASTVLRAYRRRRRNSHKEKNICILSV